MTDDLSADLASLKLDDAIGNKRSGLPRGLIWVVVIGALTAGAYYVVLPRLSEQFFKVEVETTEVLSISPSQSAVELTATGYVVPERKSRVIPHLPGRVAEVRVRQGDSVKTGDVLVRLEDVDKRSALAAARARIIAAQAQVENLKASLVEIEQKANRENALAKVGSSPQSRADELNAQAAAIKARIRAAEADAHALEAQASVTKVELDYAVVKAPMDGVVITKPAQVGEYVGTAVNIEGVLELADMSSLNVEVDVAESKLEAVKVDAPCEISLDSMGSKRFRGKVMRIDPKIDRAKATATVHVAFVDDKTGVLPDMSARVNFLSHEMDAAAAKERDKLVVPAGAIVQRDGQGFVFRIEGGRVKREAVKLGARVGADYELLEGPQSGVRLVLHPPTSLKSGQAIKEKTE